MRKNFSLVPGSPFFQVCADFTSCQRHPGETVNFVVFFFLNPHSYRKMLWSAFYFYQFTYVCVCSCLSICLCLNASLKLSLSSMFTIFDPVQATSWIFDVNALMFGSVEEITDLHRHRHTHTDPPTHTQSHTHTSTHRT